MDPRPYLERQLLSANPETRLRAQASLDELDRITDATKSKQRSAQEAAGAQTSPGKTGPAAAKTGPAQNPGTGPGPSGQIGHKYRAMPTNRGEIRFDSKSEADHYDRLVDARERGKIIMFLRQVPFHYPTGRYVADFMVFWSDGCVTVEDPKGFVTSKFREQMRQMELHYPSVCVELLTNRGVRRPATAAMAAVRQVPDECRAWGVEEWSTQRRPKRHTSTAPRSTSAANKKTDKKVPNQQNVSTQPKARRNKAKKS